MMKSKLTAIMICLVILFGCSEDLVIVMRESGGPPFQADWSGSYVDSGNISRPLQLSLKVDSSNSISGTYTMDYLDSLGTVVVLTGAASGDVIADTSGFVTLENDAFRWRLSGAIFPDFRYSGAWVALSHPGRFGDFSVGK